MASSAARRRVEIVLDATDLDQAIRETNEPPKEHGEISIDEMAIQAIWRLLNPRAAFRKETL